MGCSYETANLIIQNNKKSTVTAVTTPKSHLNDRERNCKHLLEKQFQYNNSKLNQQPTRNHNNDDCQFERVQQPENLAATNIASTIKANETSNKTISKIYKLNNDGNESYKATGDSFSNKQIIEITSLNLQAKKYKDRNNYKILGEKTRFAKAEKAYVPALQGFCINCYPIACHNRYCCEEQHKQHPQLVVDKITNQSRPTLKPSNYIKSNKSRSCSNNSYCRCHLSYFYPKHTKNTLRNEQQCVPNLHQCKCITSQGNGFATFANVHSANGHWLQKTLSHASTSLTANALDLKNNLRGVMANCAIVAESLKGINTLFIKNCLSNCTVSNKFNTNNHNNNSKNHKPEPYRGYSYRVNHLPDNRNCTTCSSSTISYTSKPSTSMSNSRSLQNATSSSCRCIEDNQYAPKNSNNNNKNMKRFNKNYSNAHNCHSYSVPHSAGFSYIGQNYYSFLRQTINFYTASSVILVLCYLTSTTSAATTKSGATTIDKHPIRGIDWSKFDESSSDKEILDLLLEKKRYDKRLLPPVNDEDFCCGLSSPDMASEIHSRRPHKRGTLTVNVNVLLLSLASPDESSLKYEVEFLLNQQWNDPRLQYGNKSHYDFLNALHHHDSIWTPDTYFIMHGDFKDPIIPMHFALRIYRNGTITYAMRRHLILSCQGSLHIFPFDDPKCSFSMESISYEEAQIKYIWKNDEDTLRKSPSLTTLNAYLIKNQTTACDQNSWRGNYSCLQVELTFTRDRAYYFTTVFIPGIILVTSSFITFWLEWNAVPARVMIGVTTMLNFFTTSNGFRSTLPVVSNLTAMNVWDGVCMCFIYASLLEFVCVNYMGRKRPQHNVVYRPGENPVTQAAAGLSSTGTSTGVTPTPATPRANILTQAHFYQEPSVGIIATAVQNLRSRSIKRRSNAGKTDEFTTRDVPPHVYEHVYIEPPVITSFSTAPSVTTTTVTIENDATDNVAETSKLRRTQSMSTNTPPLVCKSAIQTDILVGTKSEPSTEWTKPQLNDVEIMPIKPPRKKSSRSTSPSTQYEALHRDMAEMKEIAGISSIGEKKRDAGGPNEIVACTTCGGSSGSPCTHSVNNGCATETCFVQVRKKEPPHPIRIAKTIDVIARITFPVAYSIFLIFFFVHYKGFS